MIAESKLQLTPIKPSKLHLIQFYHRCLPREVDPLVYNMTHEDPGDVKYSDVGGLGEQIRELREV